MCKRPLAEVGCEVGADRSLDKVMENPTHLTCPWCPSQSFRVDAVEKGPIQEYRCPAHHKFYIEAEDTSFNFGHNKEEA
jgi:transposase-like protein